MDTARTARSDQLILVGYFLARCTEYTRGRRPKPPAALKCATWAAAYECFFATLGCSRTQGQFGNTLRNTRDAFDVLFENGRKGWAEGQKRGSALSSRDVGVHSVWQAQADDVLVDVILKIARGDAGSPKAG